MHITAERSPIQDPLFYSLTVAAGLLETSSLFWAQWEMIYTMCKQKTHCKVF